MANVNTTKKGGVRKAHSAVTVPRRNPAARELPSTISEIDERIDWAGCPIVQQDSEKLGGSPTVRAWRLPPDALLVNYDNGAYTIEELAEHYSTPIEDVRTIIDYAQKCRAAARASRS